MYYVPELEDSLVKDINSPKLICKLNATLIKFPVGFLFFIIWHADSKIYIKVEKELTTDSKQFWRRIGGKTYCLRYEHLD